MSERQTPHCLKAGACLTPQGERMRECTDERESKTYVATAPLLLAESLCLTGLQGVRESRNKSPIIDNFASICYDLDRAIALPRIPADDFKRDLFRQISVMLHATQRGGETLNSTNLATSLQLNRLGVFMPAFRARVEERNLSQGLIKQVHSGLTSYINALDTRTMRAFGLNENAKKVVGAHKAECEVMGLLSRTGRPEDFPYPALMREESSHARSQHNHDIYKISDGVKIPAQIKTSANGSGYKVAVIRHYDILRALKRDPITNIVSWNPSNEHEDYEWPNPYKYSQVIKGDVPSPLAELLLEEQEQGNYLSRDKKNTLNLATSYVLSRMQ
jgi:hypothetical protein